MSTSARNHLALAWCGPIGIVVVLAGWWLCAGFMPPPSPDLPPAEVARVWQEHTNLTRLGMVLCVWGGTLYVPFTMAVTILMRKLERDDHVLSFAQAGLGVLASVFFTLNFIVFQVVSFRQDRAAEATQGLNDLSFFLTFAPAGPFCLQYLAVAVVILQQAQQGTPLVPRWVGYANLWISLGAAPGCVLVFFKTGPLAWDGVFTFWIPVGVFVAWFFLMFWSIRRAVGGPADRSGAVPVAAAG